MRARFPLSAKILAWFFLNLALLAAVGLFFAQQKLRFGLDSLVAGRAGDRLQALAVLVLQELADAPREQWDDVLAKHGRWYGVRLFLVSERGRTIAGEAVQLPPEIAQRVREGAAPGRRPPPRDQPPPPNDREPPPDAARPPPHAPNVVGLVRAGEPPRYWALIHAPLPRLGPEGPAILLVESASLAAGGLIFDARPLLWSAGAVIVLSVLLWWPLIRGITRSIAAMQTATARIAQGRFDLPVDASRRDELGALGASINTMSERLAGLLHGQRRFLSDVAHELCAPLSRLQMALGILEHRAAGIEAAPLRDLREEVDQIATLVNELLSFSRASLGAPNLQLRAVNVRLILEQAIAREAVAGEAIELACAADLFVHADPDLLLRAVSNLLRNAIRYAADAGPIVVSAQPEDQRLVVAITDRGPGIPDELLPQIFDPFYRVDTSRTRDTGGVGLGLTIAKTAIEACGGTIAVTNCDPTGLRVTISLAR